MSFKKILPAVLIPLLFLLSSCSGGTPAAVSEGTPGAVSVETPGAASGETPAAVSGAGEFVGHWEQYSNDARTEGTVYEFFHDGGVASYAFHTATQALYPGKYDAFDSVYSSGDAILTLTPRWRGGAAAGDAGTTPTASIYHVTFVSADEMVLTLEGQADGLTYLRIPVTEMPFEARALLGKRLARESLEATLVEQVEGDLQDLYPGYVETYRDHFYEKENPVRWAAFVQAPGETFPRIYLIVEGTTEWGMVLLQKTG